MRQRVRESECVRERQRVRQTVRGALASERRLPLHPQHVECLAALSTTGAV